MTHMTLVVNWISQPRFSQSGDEGFDIKGAVILDYVQLPIFKSPLSAKPHILPIKNYIMLKKYEELNIIRPKTTQLQLQDAGKTIGKKIKMQTMNA